MQLYLTSRAEVHVHSIGAKDAGEKQLAFSSTPWRIWKWETPPNKGRDPGSRNHKCYLYLSCIYFYQPRRWALVPNKLEIRCFFVPVTNFGASSQNVKTEQKQGTPGSALPPHHCPTSHFVLHHLFKSPEILWKMEVRMSPTAQNPNPTPLLCVCCQEEQGFILFHTQNKVFNWLTVTEKKHTPHSDNYISNAY